MRNRGAFAPFWLAATVLTTPLWGASRTWDGTGNNDSDWSTKQNWTPQNVLIAGDDLFFGGANRTTNTNDTVSGTTYNSLTFNSGASAFTLGGNSITLGGAVTNNSANLQTINLPLILSATRTFSAASSDLWISGAISGTGGLEKTGANILTLTSSNGYSGGTSVTAGTLVVDGSLSTSGNVSVSGQLAGSGTVGGATTILSGGSLSPGSVGDPGQQTFSSSLTFDSGSIFNWDLDASLTDTGSANQGNYDKIVANGAVSGTAVFNVALGSNAFADAFWDTEKTWSDIFSGSGSSTLSSIFTTFGGAGVPADGHVPGRGQFSFVGNSLQWSANPEPSSLLAALLLGAGILRRKRA